MNKTEGSAEGRRYELLEKLRKFEVAAEKIHPEKEGSETAEDVARYSEAVQELQLHLSQHLATREVADWPALPDSPADISAYAGELKAEHQALIDELSKMARAADGIETALDRTEAAMQLRSQSHLLALRIARHVGKSETPLGDYL